MESPWAGRQRGSPLQKVRNQQSQQNIHGNTCRVARDSICPSAGTCWDSQRSIHRSDLCPNSSAPATTSRRPPLCTCKTKRDTAVNSPLSHNFHSYFLHSNLRVEFQYVRLNDADKICISENLRSALFFPGVARIIVYICNSARYAGLAILKQSPNHLSTS